MYGGYCQSNIGVSYATRSFYYFFFMYLLINYFFIYYFFIEQTQLDFKMASA